MTPLMQAAVERGIKAICGEEHDKSCHYPQCECNQYDKIDMRCQAEAVLTAVPFEKIVEALQCIAGHRQTIDNLMSNAEIARAILAKLQPEGKI